MWWIVTIIAFRYCNYLDKVWRGEIQNRLRKMGFSQIRKIILIFLFLYLTFSAQANSQKRGSADSIIVVNLAIVGNGTAGPYFLPDYHIFWGSETIFKQGVALERDRDYTLNYDRGILNLKEALTPQDSIKVSYSKLYSKLETAYFHRQIVYSQGHPQVTTPPETQEREWIRTRKVPSDFKLGGSKLFSLEVGSQSDFSLKQALQLSLSGHITEDVEINALLSDQGAPLTTSGTTKKLEEIDKVLIQLKSPHIEGILGDYYLSYEDNRLASYDKKLKGVKIEGKTKQLSSSFAFASSKGEYFTNRFQGIEGKQGPYKLKGKQGETDIVILAGTEKVWVDGQLMTRGSDNDYVIDYNLATIHFTPKRLVTSDSRINVDFEYSMENYQRDFYTGQFSSGFWQGKLNLKTIAIFEVENKENPLGVSLSSEDKEKLSMAGNDIYKAARDGAEFVGSGKGNYDISLDSLGNQYYVYVGSGCGVYNVAFAWVGENKGSYTYQGSGVYKYAYPTNGDYLPIIFLPMPSKHSVLDMALVLQPSKSFKSEIEWAKTNMDLNTFSSKDDQNNWGDGFDVRCDFEKSGFSLLGKESTQLKLGGIFRYLTSAFSPFGRTDRIERERDWDLPSDTNSVDQREQRYFGFFSPARSWGISLDYGKLDLLGEFGSKRRGMDLDLSPLEQIRSKIKWEDIESWQGSDSSRNNKDWIRSSIDLQADIKKITSSFDWQSEKRTSVAILNSSGEKFNQYGIGLGSLGWNNIGVWSEYSYRQDDTLQGDWLVGSVSHVWQNRLSIKDWAGSMSADLEYTRRIKHFKQIPGTDNQENLANMRFDIYPPNQVVNLNLYFSLNQTQSAQRVNNYVDAGEGNGDYIFENGQYIPYSNGNYILITELIGDLRSLTELKKNIRFLFSPYKWFLRKKDNSWKSNPLKNFYTETFINANHEISGRVKWFEYFGYPWNTSFGNAFLENSLLRQDVYFFPSDRKLTIRLRWERQRQLDNLLSYGEEKSEDIKSEILIKSQLNPQFSLETEGGKENKEDNGQSGNYQITAYYLRNQISYLPQKYVELALSGKFNHEKEKNNSLKADILTLSPKAAWWFREKGRIQGDFNWTKVSFSPENTSMPWQMASGKPAGNSFDWTFSFEYKLNQYITSSIIYDGKAEPNRKTRHFARAEARAYF